MKLYFKILCVIVVTLLVSTVAFFRYAANNRNISNLQLCGLGVTYPYYAVKGYYQKDFFHFREYIESNFKPTESYGDIIIRVQFMINCKGEIGNYRVKVYNFDYQVIDLNSVITRKFVKLINEYKFWGIPTRSNTEVNMYKFYAFKITGNRIIEILPK